MNAIIEIRNLSKKIGKKQILKDVSFSVDKGETVGLLGRNGAGKTSILKCITGLWLYDGGDIFVCGKNVKKSDNHSEIAALIGYPSLFPNMTLQENIDYFGILSLKEYDARAKELTDILNLSDVLNKKVGTFSSGMKQKACLLVALMQNPEILILDEPTSMLDPISGFEIREFIKNIKKSGISILISSHNIAELEGLCERAVVVDNGQITRFIDIKKANKRFLLEFTNPDEMKKALTEAQDFGIVIQDESSCVLLGDATVLKEFIFKTNPELRDIKNVNVLENAYVNET